MIIDANLYFALFFLNKNMYIFIWGESSIKMSEPGEYYHTHRHTHTRAYACMHKRDTASYLLEKQTPINSPRKPVLTQES